MDVELKNIIFCEMCIPISMNHRYLSSDAEQKRSNCLLKKKKKVLFLQRF